MLLAALHFDGQSEGGVQSTLLLNFQPFLHFSNKCKSLQKVNEWIQANRKQENYSAKCANTYLHVFDMSWIGMNKKTVASAQQGKAKRVAKAPRFTRARAAALLRAEML